MINVIDSDMTTTKKHNYKIIVMIPAFNEERTISKVIQEIPRKINGNKRVEILVIDDGSTDKTVEVSKKAGADYILQNVKNSGLAYTFQRGMNEALKHGADVIVNTDADFQYNQKEIPKLIQPIIDGNADIVSGNRQVEDLSHMKFAKKYGNIIGSKVVKLCAGYNIIDASSGFRAYSRKAALKLFVLSSHTYTHETLIQASHKNLKVIEVPVEFRKRHNGDSKLISSVFSHIKKSLSTIARNTLMYHSLKFFTYFGFILIALGLIPMLRFLYLGYIVDVGGQHIQSLLLGLLLMTFGGLSILLGLLSDIIATNRRHLEEILYRLKKLEYEK
jgi:glycosyltransferase involved in cell wall biosynthesis